MKKNTLYTVNKFNRLYFNPQGNVFADGSWLGISKEANPFSKQNVDAAFSKEGLNSIFSKEGLSTAPKGMGAGLLAAGAGIVGGVANKAISGGLSSGAGKAISGIGSTVGGIVGKANPLLGAAVTVGANIIGGGVNRLVGTSTNAAQVAANDAGTAALNNFISNASTLDDIRGPEAQANMRDAYKSGALRKGWADSRNEAARRKRLEAEQFAINSVANNAENLIGDQISDAAYNYRALGGALDIMQQDKYFDTINNRSKALSRNNMAMAPNTFDLGGLKAAFIQNYDSDPIAAAISYKQGLQALAEQQAEKEAADVKEQQMLDMQKKLLQLETQNNDLQTLMSALPKQYNYGSSDDSYADFSSPSSYSFEATPVSKNGQKTWDYIESQLRKSGKFNDIQIEGIKRNIARESGFDYNIYGDSGKAFGLGQWHGSRQPKDRSLEGQTAHLINTILTFGGDNWVGRDNYNGFFNARTPDEAHYYLAKGYERPAPWVMENLKKASDRSLKGYAFGGELGTNGTDWTSGLLHINTGGTHDENPLGGIPMGVDQEGTPNLVEEGETVFNDYVFSNRMKVPKDMMRTLGLGGYLKKGITFAEASKKLAKESELRPNDPISKLGLEDSMNRLAEVQETERMRQQMEEYSLQQYAYGGKVNKLADGTEDKNNLNEWFAPLAMPEVSSPTDPPGVMGPEVVITPTTPASRNTYAYDSSWDDFKYFDPKTGKYNQGYLDFANNINEDWVNRILKGQYGDMSRYLAKNKGYAITPKEVAALATDKKYSDMHKAMAAAYDEYLKGVNPVTGEIENAPAETEDFISPLAPLEATSPTNDAQGYWGPGAEGKSFFEAANETGFTGLPDKDWQGNPTGYTPNEPVYLPEGVKPEDVGTQAPMEFPSVLREREAAGEFNAGDKNKIPIYDTWMRYAPVVGAGVMTLTDLLGITNKPDYTYANKLEAAANRAGYAPNIRFNPIGDYLTYRPMDIWFEQNRLNANARATDRQIANSAAPVGTRMAGLLASGYNNQIASGELYRKALEYNDAQRAKVGDFNRATNMFNSQMGLEADSANARYTQMARQMGLSGLAQAAAMREAIDQRVGAARSLNLNNLLTSLGNIGRENFAFNQINSDKGYYNGVRHNGVSYYHGKKK